MSKKEFKRQLVTPVDIQNYTSRCLEQCRRQIRKVRAKLGKGPRDYVSVKEYCEVTKTDENEFRKFMLSPVLYLAVILALIYVFRDDMDLYFLWTMVITIIRLEFIGFNKTWLKMRAFLIRPRSNSELKADIAPVIPPSEKKKLFIYAFTALILFVAGLYQVINHLGRETALWQKLGAYAGLVLYGSGLICLLVVLVRSKNSYRQTESLDQKEEA